MSDKSPPIERETPTNITSWAFPTLQYLSRVNYLVRFDDN